jgi:hypothetical protein
MVSNTTKMSIPDKKRQLGIAIIVYLSYVGIILLANVLMKIRITTGNEMYEAIGGMLFGFLAIPLLSVILPFLLAKRWNLQCSFWPRDKPWGMVVIVVLLVYCYFGFRESIATVVSNGIPLKDFIIHLLSVSMFHIPYYPLFLVFIFPIVRKNFGLFWGILITAVAFGVYHCSQFHNFPEGLSIRIQVFFIAEFIVILVLYLWGQSIIILSVAHAVVGAFDLAANNYLSTDVDFVFVIALVVSGATLGYMVMQALQKVKKLDPEWWPQISYTDK